MTSLDLRPIAAAAYSPEVGHVSTADGHVFVRLRRDHRGHTSTWSSATVPGVLVVAHRGTVPTDMSDVRADIELALGWSIGLPALPQRLVEAEAYTRRERTLALRVVHVGHSLGASIALILAYRLKQWAVAFSPHINPRMSWWTFRYTNRMTIHGLVADPVFAATALDRYIRPGGALATWHVDAGSGSPLADHAVGGKPPRPPGAASSASVPG